MTSGERALWEATRQEARPDDFMRTEIKETLQRVGKTLAQAMTRAEAAAVFVRCDRVELQDEALDLIPRISQRVVFHRVRLEDEVDPVDALARVLENPRSIALIEHCSKPVMSRLNRDADRYRDAGVRAVFLLLPGQVTLFARSAKRLWDSRQLYLAWPRSEAEDPKNAEARQLADGSPAESTSAIRRRIEAALTIEEPRMRGNAIFTACRDAFLSGDFDTAGEFMMKAIRDLKDEGSTEELAEALQLLGSMAEARGDLQSALDWYTESLQYWEAAEAPVGLAAIYTRLGSLHFMRDELDQAQRYLERAQEFELTLGSPLRICDAFRFNGMLRERLGDLKGAAELFDKAEAIAIEQDDDGRLARVLHQMGHLFERQEQWQQAQDIYTRALRTRERLRDLRGMASTLHQLGNIHYNRAEYKEATAAYKRAIEFESKVGDDQGLATTLLQLAHLAEERFQHSLAYACLVQCRPLLRRLRSPLLTSAEGRIERVRTLLTTEEIRRIDTELGIYRPSAAELHAQSEKSRPRPTRERPKKKAADDFSFSSLAEELTGFKHLLDDD